jgi:hypothetical protein
MMLPMPLLATVDSLDGVPEAARDLYTARDGKFHLAVDGLVPSARLSEFRDNNIAYKKELDTLKAQFDGVDPEKYRELTAKEQKLLDKKLIDAGKVDELVEQRVGAMRTEHERVVADLNTKLGGSTKALEGLVIDSALRDAASASGVRSTAIEDVLLRGRAAFKLHEGKAVAFDGDKPAFGKDGGPLSITEWTAGLAERAPHLFESSNGGGAANGNGAGGGSGSIRRTDNAAFLANIDKIAGGAVKVA